MLSKSNEDYIEAIYILELTNQPILSVRISEMLAVSKPAVNKAMNDLKEKGLIAKDYYSKVALTESGRQLAQEIYSKHTTIKDFLIKIGVDEETANIDCCKIEHVISEKTLKCLKDFCKGK